MSDNEEENEMAVEEEVTAEEAEAELDTIDALKIVLQTALVHDGLRRGLHECIKALEKDQGQLCILAQDCDNDEYTKLVQAFCQEKDVKLIMAEEGKELGEWCGLAKRNPEDGTIKKQVRCSCAVITKFGEESRALQVVQAYVDSQ